MKRTLTLCACLCALFASDISAQHYWVGGTGNWSDPMHWATTSGGSVLHAAAPTMNDDVIFDANSFTSGGQTVTMDLNQGECRSMTWAGVQNNPGFNSSTSDAINIFGDLTLSPDMTCNLRFVEFESAGTTEINTAGTNLGANSIVRFNGGGIYNLNSVVDVREVQVARGTLNSNNNTINCEFAVRLTGTGPMTINLGTSLVDTRQWRTSGSNITLNVTNSTIDCQSFYCDEANSGPYTYGDLIIRDGGIISGVGTFNNITLLNPGGADRVRLFAGSNITCNQFTAQGTRYSPLELESATEGQSATITQNTGVVVAEYLIMRDIHAAGGAMFTAENSIDRGNNTGWTINPVTIEDFYWVGGEGNWTDTDHWATSSGGATLHGRFPSQFDNVWFDANSFSIDNEAVTLDTVAQTLNVDWTGVTTRPRFASNDFYNNLNVFGSIDLGDSTLLQIANVNMQGSGDNLICDLGDNGLSNLAFWGDGSWTLMSDITCGNFSAYGGELNTNDQSITVSFSFTVGNTSGASIDLTDSDISALRFRVRDEDNDFDAGTSHITARGEFEGSGFAFYEVTLTENVTVEQSNSYEILRVAPGTSVMFEADSIQTINDQLILEGTPEEPINMSSTIGGSQATLAKASGVVDGIYLILKDMNATGGATFNATQTIDDGNNTGWNIEEIVPLDFYWVGGTGNWSDAANHWAKSSGGNQFYTFVPGPADNVYFDENSFTDMGQTVTMDVEQVNFNDMDWAGVTEMPSLVGFNTTINVYGSLQFAPLFDMDTRFYNFLSDEEEVIDFGDPTFPGTSAVLTFSGGGTWSMQDSMTTRELFLENGTFNTNSHGLHVDFQTRFDGPDAKRMNLGTSNYYTRSLQWGGFGSENLAFDGSQSKIFCSSSFQINTPTVTQPDSVTLNELTFIASADQARVFGYLKLNKLTIEPGKEVTLFPGHEVETKELVVRGTEDAFITLRGQTEGSQAIIKQESGTVDGEYLELKDISATGGATFNAYNSINNGNVSGWTFFGQAQTIDFEPIDDRLESDGPFSIMATATSGLPVTFEVVAGPATVEGGIVTLNGAGEIQIKASQEGDINFNPAPSVIQSFCATPQKPTVTVDATDPSLLISSRADGNQWLRDGNPIDGATESTYTATVSGMYSVQTVFGSCASEPSDAVQVTISSTQDVIEGQLKAWPVPTSDELFIELTAEDITSFSIYSSTGQRIMYGKGSATNDRQLSIDVSSIAAGMYYVLVETRTGVHRVPLVKG